MSASPGPGGSAWRARATGLAVGVAGLALIALGIGVTRRWADVHMTANYCTMTSNEAHRGPILRWVLITVGVAVLLLVRRAARWASRSSPREMASAVLRVVVAGLLALVVCDVWMRIRKHPEPPDPGLHYEPESQGDELLWYEPIPSHVTEMVVEGKPLRFVIDANGWRVRSMADVVDFGKPTVLFTGESIASGFGLNYEDTYPFYVGEDLGVQAVDVAVQDYGNDAAYVRLSAALVHFQHPIATVSLVNEVMTDRNVWPERPHMVVGDDGSRTVEPIRDVSGWVARSPLLHLVKNVIHSDEGLRRARSTIVATARETRAAGGFPLFVYTNYREPCLPDETGAPSLERNLFEGLDVAHIRVDLAEPTFDKVIMHPDATAHRKLADAITRALREHGVTGR